MRRGCAGCALVLVVLALAVAAGLLAHAWAAGVIHPPVTTPASCPPRPPATSPARGYRPTPAGAYDLEDC
jgi:hypothetical protein